MTGLPGRGLEDPMPRRTRPARRLLGAAVALVLLTAASCSGPDEDCCAIPNLGGTAGPDLALAATLQPFDTCPDVLRWFQDEALKRVGPYGLDGSGGAVVADSAERLSAGADAPVAAGSGADAPDFSRTNVQEAGVDEPDVVKTDGRHVFAVAGHQLRILDVSGQSPTLTSRLGLPGEGTTRLLLDGDRLLAIDDQPWSFAVDPAEPGGAARSLPLPMQAATRLTLIDVADPAEPAIRSSIVVDGSHVDVRLVGGRARVVTSSAPGPLPFVYPAGGSTEAVEIARRANEDAIRRSTVEDWLPSVRDGDAAPDAPGEPLVACERLRHPKEFSGFETLTVLSLDLGADTLDTADSVGLVAGGEIAYASTEHLYVTTTALVLDTDGADPVEGPRETTDPDRPTSDDPRTAPVAPAEPGATEPGATEPAEPDVAPSIPWVPANRSAVHAFAITEPGPAQYRASGLVEGTIADRWSLSEHDGHLRVVSTLGSWGRGGAGTESKVSVLDERDGELIVVGSVGDMGRGEAVMAVRFHGEIGYVVTFRQIDPFYVLDLSDPRQPKVAGELKMPGYSAYLHPVGEGRVLGVGQDADERGITRGTKVSLFDVSDPAEPRELAQQVLPATSSEVEMDSRAFLWWAPTRLAVVPTWSAWRGPSAGTATVAVGFRVTDDAVSEVGRIDVDPTTRPDGTPVRALVIRDAVVTVTGVGVRTSELDTLASRDWLAL
jgi:hypothetical protein